MSDAQEDLVRQVVLPAFFEALQVDMAAEELHQMQPVYRLAHWKEMLLVSLRNGRWLRATCDIFRIFLLCPAALLNFLRRADFVVAGFESGGSSSLVHYLHRVPDTELVKGLGISPRDGPYWTMNQHSKVTGE